jgi:hypothetical protein
MQDDHNKQHLSVPGLTRRDFIRAGSAAAIGGFCGLPILAQARPASQSRVVLIRDPNVVNGSGDIRTEVLIKMLDQGMATLTDTGDPQSAWQQLFQANDVVGVKSNVWRALSTPSALEETVRERLLQVGVKRNDLAIDDRRVRSNAVFQRATALINMRPLRTHHWSGLGTLIKNYIMFTAQPWTYHGNACERLGAVWHLPGIKGKTRLNILVMLTPLFHGIGPHHFSRKYIWPYAGLILSTDPVAADATGARVIQAKRDAFFGEPRPISPPPGHIIAADQQFGLGNSQPADIDLITLGWDEDRLI